MAELGKEPPSSPVSAAPPSRCGRCVLVCQWGLLGGEPGVLPPPWSDASGDEQKLHSAPNFHVLSKEKLCCEAMAAPSAP